MADHPTYDESDEPFDSTHRDSDTAPRPVGNRPADNALHASGESELNLSWQGGEGAADFLGLDQELRAPAAPTPAPIRMSEPQPATPTEHSIAVDEDQAPYLDSRDTYVDEPLETEEDQESWLLQEGAEAEETESDLEYAGALESSYHEPGSGRSPLRLAAFVSLALVVGAGVWYMAPRTADVDTTIAPLVGSAPNDVRPQPALPTSSGEVATNTGTDPAGSVETPVDVEGTAAPTATAAGAPDERELLSDLADLIAEVEGDAGPVASGETTPGGASNPLTAPGPNLAGAAGTTAVEPGQGVTEPATRPGEDGRVERVVQLDPSEMVLLPDYKSNLRLASAEELASLWPQATIPFEQIDGEQRLLTPNVGRVRVIISGDELFEGTLYAVGEGHVWVDTKIGRVALTAASVHDIQQLGGNHQTPELGGVGSQSLAGLPRVRVRSAGGHFYGKVVAREGDLVTLIPDSGGRIRLHSSEVEVVGNMRTSLIRDQRAVDASGPEPR